METDLDLMLDRRIMQAALAGRNLPSAQALQDIDRVRKAVNARRKLSGDLARLYDSYAALAAYDASAEVTAAFRQVTANANELTTGAKLSFERTARRPGRHHILADAVGLQTRCRCPSLGVDR
jgi:hypothetical protein